MKTKLLKDISASTIQVVMNQVLGLLVFLIVSRYLVKEQYGELNWSLAVLSFITTLLSLRLEQVVVKRIAAGEDASSLLTIFAGHIFFGGIVFYCVLLAGNSLFPLFFARHNLLLVLAVSQLLSFFSLPFKQVAAGKQSFGWLALMSLAANLIRAVWLVWMIFFSSMDIRGVLVVFIVSSFAELLICVYVSARRMNARLNPRHSLQQYFALITDSLPQVGMVFLNACIARIDWILLGFFSTQVITAEYSFAYKIFELSPVPLLIIGPVLLSKLSAYFSSHPEGSLLVHGTKLNLLIRFEMIMAGLIPLVLNIVWTPLIDGLTGNKYGAVNTVPFFLLSLSVPFQYMINLFWSIHFSLGRLAMIFRITAVTCLIIIAGDTLLIPLFNARGAAFVYLLAMVTEYALYLRRTRYIPAKTGFYPLLICTGIAVTSGVPVYFIDIPVIAKLSLALVIYFGLLLITGQLKKSDWSLIRLNFWKPDTLQPVIR